MLQSPFRPLPFSELLDRSFRLYRQHFVKFILLTLVTFGPIYFLYSFLLSEAMGDTLTSFRTLGENYAVEAVLSTDTSSAANPLFAVVAIVLVPIMMLCILPVAVSAVTHMVGSIYNHREPEIGPALKVSFKRFGYLLANSLLYCLILVGVYIAVVIALTIVILIFSLVIGIGMGISAWTGPGFSPAMLLIGIMLYFAFIAGICCLVGHFLLRFGFFIPVVAFEGLGIGMGRSWNMTKGNFWRVFFSFTVMSLVFSSLFTGNTILVEWAFPDSMLGVLCSVVLSMLVMPVVLILYGVAYFDMRSRREGLDLREMLYNLKHGAGMVNPVGVKEIQFHE